MSEFCEHGPVTALHCYKVSSLIRSNTVWNTVMVGKTLCESMGGGFDRSYDGEASENVISPGTSPLQIGVSVVIIMHKM